MLSSTFLTVAFLAPILSLGSALMCYECTNITGSHLKDCGSPATQTCSSGYNGCVIALFHVDTPFKDSAFQMLRNCSSNCVKETVCATMNKTANGAVLDCTVECCTGEKCNLNFLAAPATTAPVATTTPVVTSQVPDPKMTTGEPTESNMTTTPPPVAGPTDSPAVQLLSGSVLMVVALVFGKFF